MRVCVLSTAAACFGFAATSASAADVHEKVELNWAVPEGCPKQDEFLAALSRMLGDRVSIDGVLYADITIVQSGAISFQLMLTTKLGGSSGRRVIAGRSCTAVADAAAVTLALLLNPDLELADEPEPNGEPGNPTSTPVHKASAPAQPAARKEVAVPSDEPRMQLLISSELGVQTGVLPRANPQLSVGVGIARGRGSIWATTIYSLPQNVTIAPPNLGGRLWVASAVIAGCWFWAQASPRLGNCIGAEMTRLYGHGTGVTHTRDATTTWVAPILSINVDTAFHRQAWLRIAASGMLPLARPDTHLDDLGTVQKPAKIAGNLNAGIVVGF